MIPHISLLELLEGVEDSVGAEMNGGNGGQVTSLDPYVSSNPPPAGFAGDLPGERGGSCFVRGRG
jgi:hypothetical protein